MQGPNLIFSEINMLKFSNSNLISLETNNDPYESNEWEYGNVDFEEAEEELEVKDDDASDEEKKDDELSEDELLDGKTKKDKESDEDDDESDDDKEDDDEEDEKEQLAKVSFTDIKKFNEGQYKDFFKDFPTLKPLFFKAQEFEKRFSSLESADEAIEKVGAYDEIKDLVTSGDAKGFLENLKDASPKAVAKFSESFLPDLAEFDEKLYVAITKPVILDILNQVLQVGKDRNDTNIQNAAKLAHKVVFGTTELGKPEFKSKEKDDELENDKNEFLREKQNNLVQAVTTILDTELEKEILKGLDPTNALKERPGLKKRIIKEIKTEIDEALANDAAHLSRMNGLWARERRAKYTGQLKDSITTAYLSRAKALIPAVRKRVRTDYLGKQKSEDKEVENKVNGRRIDLSAGRMANNKTKPITVEEARKKGLTDRDIIG